MAKRKQKSGKSARIVLALLGVGLLLWNINTIGLYFLGDVAPAYDIILSRSGTGGDSAVGTEYRFSASYKYAVDGVEYDGLDTGLRGPRLGPKHDDTVHYYPFAPRIGSLYAEDAVSPGMLLTCGFSLALILFAVIPRKAEKGKTFGKKKRYNEDQPERVAMAWLTEHTEDYDDAREEYYENGLDEVTPRGNASAESGIRKTPVKTAADERLG